MNRRSFLTGLIAAPAIVRPHILMPVKPLALCPSFLWTPETGYEAVEAMLAAQAMYRGIITSFEYNYQRDMLLFGESMDEIVRMIEPHDTPFVRLAGRESHPARLADPIDGPAPFCA